MKSFTELDREEEIKYIKSYEDYRDIMEDNLFICEVEELSDKDLIKIGRIIHEKEISC